MSKKNLIIILAICVLIIVILIVQAIRKNKTQNVESSLITNETTAITYEEGENPDEYIIYDKDTGEEITHVFGEGAVKMYEDDPSYNPKLTSMDADFIDPEGVKEE